MSFKNEMNQLAVELIELDEEFSTIAQDVIHRKPISQTYDEETGDVYSFDSETLVTAIIGPFTDTQNNANDVEVGDLKMIAACITMEQTPEPQNDIMILSNGYAFRVLSVTLDASGSVYTLQLRKTSVE